MSAARDEDALPPHRVPWEPAYEAGHALLDAQHRALLEHCNRMAGLCGPGAGGAAAIGPALAALKALVRQHVETESALLAEGGVPDAEDHLAECEEFDYLADEIATPANFDPVELQRFAALWCVGHIVGSVALLRDLPPAGHLAG